MRFNDIKPLQESDLFEINMSPSSLEKLASQIDARAGMEFEMIVPNISNPDDDVEYEPNYDMDERCRSIDDAVEFFHDGDYNGRREVERLRERMRNDYSEWVMEQIDNEWENNKEDVIQSWVKENVDPEEWLSLVNDTTSEEEAFEQFVGDIADDYNNSYYESALDEFREEKYQDYDENDWLSDQDLDLMSNIESAYEISWPYYNENRGGGEGNIDAIADDFSTAIGRPVNASSSYHGGRREAGKYVVEPDGSLDPDDSDDMGLEFVSPPMSIQEMFDDLDRVRIWAKNTGCYTNKSTGLHMNVSVPSWTGDLRKLDYVKLALLLGDEYVLNQFGRISNTYTQSAMAKVREQARGRPEDVAALLQQMKQNLSDAASKVIHTGVTSKYTSINTKDGYVEFRSPGGNWLADLQRDPAKIKNTLLRFVVALDAAANPEKYREEYLKKLYKLLGAKSEGSKDTVSFFADYVAGKMPKAALKSFIKQAQLERKVAKNPTGNQPYWWEVSNPQYSLAVINVVARTKEEAIEKALAPDGYPSWNSTRQLVVAKPLRPYDKSAVKASIGEPQPIGQQQTRSSAAQTDYENRLGWPDQTGDANYEIVDRSTGRRQMVFVANTEQDAQRKYNQWLGVAGFPEDTENFGYRELVVPGSTIDLQRQRARQSGGVFTGTWIIRDPDGRELHRFSGIGNQQADANNFAVRWLRSNPQHMQTGVEVVPEIQ